ncbi:hypothetical protein G6011_06273 [Alternaria panax]|uniref:Zn(2)-C6 fungal-type domain-containing protein n=1 Tax=Alternaria panax TaxID=48097 RepID=A0AAD4I5B5_9PLEO|nr:hypothetical protein G6011_06273 [Alternaria panax]
MPSKSRGLRTSTGCLTCRKRKVKCDENHPSCRNCERVHRECVYAEKTPTTPRQRASNARNPNGIPDITDSVPANNEIEPGCAGVSALSSEPVEPIQSWASFPAEQPGLSESVIPNDDFFLDDSLFNFGDSLTPNFGPVEWYDLLAEDAINNMQGQTHSNRWNFDIASLSRRQSPRQSVALEADDNPFRNVDVDAIAIPEQPWNTETKIELERQELAYFEHYVSVVAPILDLFDPLKHFADVVPHLALHNGGLLKSLLAVGACHMALSQDQDPSNEVASQAPSGTPASPSSASPTIRMVAEQLYYETLQYLSQNLFYQSYTKSREILVTAIMISTYEMFGTASTSDHSNWDRHLRGAFWIQRNSDTSGESTDGLQRAVWWAWLRQDVWAAFRTGRPALTIHQPRVPMAELTLEGLATRIIYIAAKCTSLMTPENKRLLTKQALQVPAFANDIHNYNLSLVGFTTTLAQSDPLRILPLNWSFAISFIRGPGCPKFGQNETLSRTTRLTFGPNAVDGSEIYYWFVAYPWMRYKDVDKTAEAEEYKLRLHKNGTKGIMIYELDEGVQVYWDFSYYVGEENGRTEVADITALTGPASSGQYSQEHYSIISYPPELIPQSKCGSGTFKFRTEMWIKGKDGQKGVVNSEQFYSEELRN